jgi:hypothetical protein
MWGVIASVQQALQGKIIDTRERRALCQAPSSPVGASKSMPTTSLRLVGWAAGICLLETCCGCCEVTTRSTKVDYMMYLGNSNGVLLVLILSCCEDESILLA